VPRYLAPLSPFPIENVCSLDQFKQVCELLRRGDFNSAYTAMRHTTIPLDAVDIRDALWVLTSVAAEGIEDSRVPPRGRVYQIDRQALSLFHDSPYSPIRVLRLATICFADGRFNEARSWLAMFLSDYPKHPCSDRAALLWCESMVAKRDFKEAADALGVLEARISGDLRARLLADRAYALYELGREDEAKSLWGRVIDLKEDVSDFPPWAIIGLARFLRGRGEVEVAIEMLRTVEEEPWQVEARVLEILWSGLDERSRLEEIERLWVEAEDSPLRGKLILPVAAELVRSEDSEIRARAGGVLLDIKDGDFSPATRFEAIWTLAQAAYADGRELEALEFLDELLLNLRTNPFAPEGLKLYARIFKRRYADLSKSDPLLASAFFVRCRRGLSPALIEESVWARIRDDLARARLFDTLYRLSKWPPLRDRYMELARSAEALSLALAKDPIEGELILEELVESGRYAGFASYILGMLAWSRSDVERAIGMWKRASTYGNKYGRMAKHRLLLALLALGREEEAVRLVTGEEVADEDELAVAIALERVGAKRAASGLWRGVATGTGHSRNLAGVKLNNPDGLQDPWAAYLSLSSRVGVFSESIRRDKSENTF